MFKFRQSLAVDVRESVLARQSMRFFNEALNVLKNRLIVSQTVHTPPL